MLSGPFKLIIGTAVVAVLMGSVLAAKGPGTPSGAATPPQPQAHSKGWFSGWFDGMEFNRKAPPAPVTAATPAQARQPGMAAGYGRVDLKSDAGGQYSAQVEIDGQRIPMLVDTGATLVTLSYDDARRVGVRPSPADFRSDIHTANGVTKGARVVLPEVRLGTLNVRNVDAIVLGEGIKINSLLGMSFLSKLKFEIADGNLLLRQ